MPGVRVLGLAVLLSLSAFGQGSGYFPLQTGNQWTYRCTGLCGTELPALAISKDAVFGGKRYWLFKGFHGSETWLREDENGVVWAYDPAAGTETPWYAFLTPAGGSFDTSVDPCSKRATVISRNALYQGPVGAFENALRIAYPLGPCADAGLEEEFFGREIGLLRRTETTIGGPRTYDLVQARIGGTTVVSQPELSFSLTLDRKVYYINLMPPIDPQTSIPRMTARLTLRNTTGQPVPLTFASGQRYDLELRNERGEAVYRWSDGQAFTMIFGEQSFGPGETNYTIVVRLADKEGKALPPGRYVAEGWLTSTEPRAFRASVGFEIQQVY